MKNDLSKNKHLTLDERIDIQECLAKGMTFKAIAKRIGKCQTTISREVKLHAQSHSNLFVKTDETCPLLLKSPFVCNGCDKKSKASCPFVRRLYFAKYAQSQYETTRSEVRSGIPLSKESFYKTEQIISAAVLNGQHIYHAITANKLPVSTATVYRHIKLRYYSISPIDLPRAVKFKPRNRQKAEYIPTWAKKGRLYADFLSYIEHNQDVPRTQLDTVIGRIGGKVIMTIHFVSCDFMIGLLLENKTAAEAAHKISELKQRLLSCGFSFGKIVPVLLTDNGGEFSIVSAFENDANNQLETHLFFCEPNSPSEKPEIEKNHTLLRDIVPKGTSFDDFTQNNIDLIFSHINAVNRKQFNGKSAYDMFSFSYSQELATALGITFIPPTEVIQNASLVKKF